MEKAKAKAKTFWTSNPCRPKSRQNKDKPRSNSPKTWNQGKETTKSGKSFLVYGENRVTGVAGVITSADDEVGKVDNYLDNLLGVVDKNMKKFESIFS